jgi:hypothetical protein
VAGACTTLPQERTCKVWTVTLQGSQSPTSRPIRGKATNVHNEPVFNTFVLHVNDMKEC